MVDQDVGAAAKMLRVAAATQVGPPLPLVFEGVAKAEKPGCMTIGQARAMHASVLGYSAANMIQTSRTPPHSKSDQQSTNLAIHVAPPDPLGASTSLDYDDSNDSETRIAKLKTINFL